MKNLTKLEYFSGLVMQSLLRISTNRTTLQSMEESKRRGYLYLLYYQMSVEYATTLLKELENSKSLF